MSDYAENETVETELPTGQLWVDKTGPEISVAIEEGSEPGRFYAVPTAVDNEVGTIDESTWRYRFKEQDPWQEFNDNSVEVKTSDISISFKVSDTLGNSTEFEVILNLDKKAPVISLTRHPDVEWTNDIHEGRRSTRDGARKNWVQKTKKFKRNPKTCMRHDFLAFINSMRKRRKILQGAKYHVMARANHREMILA